MSKSDCCFCDGCNGCKNTKGPHQFCGTTHCAFCGSAMSRNRLCSDETLRKNLAERQ